MDWAMLYTKRGCLYWKRAPGLSRERTGRLTCLGAWTDRRFEDFNLVHVSVLSIDREASQSE